MPTVALFAGVDGGGSKTLAVVVDGDGRERGRATTGSSNTTAVGFAHAVEQLQAAVTEAARLAGGDLPLRAIWIGLAGVDRPGARDALLPHLRHLGDDFRLTNDAELALTALDGAVGVALIAGTGSIALGRDATGATARAGGWGHLFGDEGSGYELGQRALQASVRAADGRGQATALLDAILRRWGLDDPFDLIGHVYLDHRDDAKPAIAELSSLVFATAHDGDQIARRIIATAAGELALTAIAVGDRLSFPNGEMPLALSGGLLTGNAAFRAMVLRRVRRRRQVGQVALAADPALSAARMATMALSGDDRG